ncbi:putative Two component system response regulator [Desulfosarcina cetonica]|uniref:response regulator n=1 Tax=Desulfosarcina cetonica TaxID=90730 RepID=UPI0006D0393F|nr:response regulator [Desulfosarcina cetonica]VTR68151.1 putative Two component system response regulator [Desulfosarcina cetonica]
MERQLARRKPGTQILIVENEILLAEDLVLTLQDMGYGACERVSTGEAAVDRVSRGRVDLVLMDIRLDGRMDGIETAERINAMADIPIVYITAFSDETVLERAKKTMPQGYLLKPFRNNQLKAAIEISFYRAERDKRGRNRLKTPEQGAGQNAMTDPVLVLCSHCKRIKNQDDLWQDVEGYIESHLPTACSHSICPACAQAFYPDYGLYE